MLERELGVQSYFCKPQGPWPKGSVENLNGRLRRHVRLDRDITAPSREEPQALTRQLNATPRKCLSYRTPAEALAARFTPG